MRMCARFNFRLYVLLLGIIYFCMLYVFHGHLQSDACRGRQCGRELLLQTQRAKMAARDKMVALVTLAIVGSDTNRRVLESRNVLTNDTAFHIPVKPLPNHRAQTNLTHSAARKEDHGNQPTSAHRVLRKQLYIVQNLTRTTIAAIARIQEDCFLPANHSGRKFQELEPNSYVYSAYYDERYEKPFVRIMAIINLNKVSRKLKVYCHFSHNGTFLKQEATFYELCENHGKMFGGFILSCEVPKAAVNVCSVTVSMEIIPVTSSYRMPRTSSRLLPVTRLQIPSSTNTDSDAKMIPISSPKFNFTICVPPLFGSISNYKLIEFIELHRLLGFQHFIFYLSVIDDPKLLKILHYYQRLNIVTLIKFVLPPVMVKTKIWYNGQLSAHNDCIYRAMPQTRYLAIIDIDEFIVPHNGQFTVTDTVQRVFDDANNVCGLSFDSAFYDSKYTERRVDTSLPLITQAFTGRSALFSKVRTKVLVRPERIFEVGIHHISKPSSEKYKVVKMNTTDAFLHHYRACVSNYGMKCSSFTNDATMLQYGKELKFLVSDVIKNVFPSGLEL